MTGKRSVQGRLRGLQRALARQAPAQGASVRLVWQTDEPGVYVAEATGQRVTRDELGGQVVALSWGDEQAEEA